jgi:heme/copper-type cytochrome/quinol oxidase subunit 4
MQFQPDAAPVFGAIFIILIILFALILTVIQIVAFCKIFSKAGYSWALGLLIFVPIANIIMFLFLALADWPIQRELRSYKQQNQMV